MEVGHSKTLNNLRGKKKGIVTIAFFLCLVFVLLHVIHDDHDNDDAGGTCEVCLIVENLLKLFGAAAGSEAYTYLGILAFMAVFSEVFLSSEKETPVELKNRMNN